MVTKQRWTNVRQIQRLHQVDRGWNDVAYNFLVGDTGQIYEGRGFGNRSAAQGGNSRQEINYNNKHYVAVCWLGGSEPTHKPSDKAVKSIKWLYEQVGGELRPHSSFKQTSCPGDRLETTHYREVYLLAPIEEFKCHQTYGAS